MWCFGNCCWPIYFRDAMPTEEWLVHANRPLVNIFLKTGHRHTDQPPYWVSGARPRNNEIHGPPPKTTACTSTLLGQFQPPKRHRKMLVMPPPTDRHFTCDRPHLSQPRMLSRCKALLWHLSLVASSCAFGSAPLTNRSDPSHESLERQVVQRGSCDGTNDGGIWSTWSMEPKAAPH